MSRPRSSWILKVEVRVHLNDLDYVVKRIQDDGYTLIDLENTKVNGILQVGLPGSRAWSEGEVATLISYLEHLQVHLRMEPAIQIPVVNMGESFNKAPEAFLDYAMKLTEGSSAFRNDRQRPYDGQPWTDFGLRGQTTVVGLTFRDIVDCLAKTMLRSAGIGHKVDDGSWTLDDVRDLNLSGVHPGTLAQILPTEIEKMMGIYPNVPEGCDPDDILTSMLNTASSDLPQLGD